ncbi:hypothetical protein BXZ70DRAFT_922934 [Cristinia sonorae]|uniref:F-box domain-containing protein n=1 Tax=Cristinia sonorae TaxID=1940300 RepID=A0A8K0UUX7_9AGAR|nr:hypothetical protein BXZ70DRAFT_922934 [Cristinia sonorae]
MLTADNPPRYYLPRELLDSIFIHLDKPDLSTCTILCCHFHISARALLFLRINLIARGAVLSLTEYLSRFRAFLMGQPSVACWVKKLRIAVKYSIDQPYETIHHCDISTLLRLLPSLQTLELCEIEIQASPVDGACHKPISLHRLSLNGVTFSLSSSYDHTALIGTDNRSEGSLVQFFNLFGFVDHLYVLIQFTEEREDPGVEAYINQNSYDRIKRQGRLLSDAFRVKRVTATWEDGCDRSYKVFWLFGGSRVQDDLQCLELDDCLWNIRYGLEQQVFKSLQHLHLRFTEFETYGDLETSKFNLPACPTLTCLLLDMRDADLDDSDAGSLPLCLHLVRQLPPTTQRLSFKLNFLESHHSNIWREDSQGEQWLATDTFLASHAGLQKINFVFDYDGTMDVGGLVKVNLPRAQAAKTLNIWTQ